MATQPQVLGLSAVAGGVELELRIPPELDYLPDHFPRFPMVPGVVQLDWAIAFGRQHLGIDGEFRGIAGLKFQHPLLPRATVTLTLGGDGTELSFAYRTGARPCSSGRVQFAATGAA
jgi:3-hydroxymyristoyl/3-hydroxydecanoyl-(acyl carrier protein) dehydratase